MQYQWGYIFNWVQNLAYDFLVGGAVAFGLLSCFSIHGEEGKSEPDKKGRKRRKEWNGGNKKERLAVDREGETSKEQKQREEERKKVVPGKARKREIGD